MMHSLHQSSLLSVYVHTGNTSDPNTEEFFTFRSQSNGWISVFRHFATDYKLKFIQLMTLAS
jgi:hypothetical protein